MIIDPSIIPWSCEAEQSVLGGLLLANAAWDRVADLLTGRSFYDSRHRHIFDATGALIAASKPADVLTVHEELKRRRQDEECGGLVYLNALAQSVPSAANIRRYAEIVAEFAGQRNLMAAADQAFEIAKAPQGDYTAKLNEIAGLFALLEQRAMRNDPQPLNELVIRQLDHYTDLYEGRVTAGWPTGFEKLDTMLNGGFRPGHMIILGARPKIGKTSFAMELLIHQAMAGRPCLALTQEMPAAELTDRLISRMAKVDHGHLQTGKLSDKEWSRISEAADAASKLSVLIDDQPALTMADIRAKARKAFPAGRRADGGLLVVDYLQLTSGSSGSDGNRNQEIEQVSRGIKALAKQLGITALVLSQLNRKVEDRANKRPYLGDLRDSGAIEQDADTVIFLWPIRDDHGGACRITGLDVAANRHGPTGEFALDFWKAYQRWVQSEASTDQGPRAAQRSEGGFE